MAILGIGLLLVAEEVVVKGEVLLFDRHLGKMRLGSEAQRRRFLEAAGQTLLEDDISEVGGAEGSVQQRLMDGLEDLGPAVEVGHVVYLGEMMVKI
jgi:hypothetical protein